VNFGLLRADGGGWPAHGSNGGGFGVTGASTKGNFAAAVSAARKSGPSLLRISNAWTLKRVERRLLRSG